MKNGVLKVDEEFCTIANRDVSISLVTWIKVFEQNIRKS